MLENNVVINFASYKNVRELSELLDDVLRALGLSLLNREVVKLRTQLTPNEYQLIINLVLTEVQERAIRELFSYRKYKIFSSEFDNL